MHPTHCFAWQLAKANALCEKEGFSKFISVQNHYNLIFREEEREMAPFCTEENIALTPYSALAAGRLSRLPNEEATKRLVEDDYAKLKYDACKAQDEIIIKRVFELAAKYNVSMTEIALSRLLTKVTSPVVGATKLNQLKSLTNSVDIQLDDKDILYLEECYVPHNLSGVMAQNTLANAKKKKVWSNAAKIK